jgi:hypothetical protein
MSSFIAHTSVDCHHAFDLRPAAGTRDDEVARLLGLGATEIDDRREENGAGWRVLTDPEGNEFCVLRSDAELSRDTRTMGD